ncbi:hypothetical protein K1719_029985 [Acacia pycnantha]|nr:hypothetical protein K1719_029985 [Acacia pycnantha]
MCIGKVIPVQIALQMLSLSCKRPDAVLNLFVYILHSLFGPYGISKTLTEKAVLEFGEQNGLDVVTVIPPLVVGPFI